MSKEKEINCRLCLEFLDGYYTVIEERAREIFEFLLLKMDLSISEEPVVCKSCMEIVQAAFKFKSTCIFVDEQIVSLARERNSSELDMRDVYLNENENKSLVFNEDYNICRFCLQCLENFNLLNDLKNNSTEKKLLKCIPELEMNIIKEPVVCTACMISLEAYYSFAVKCQNMEENIMKYCEIEEAEHNGQISLSNVLKFQIKGMPECIDNCSKTAALKEDNMFQNEGNTYSDISNILIKMKEEELIIKDENMLEDCETEEDRCGESGRKEVVNYDMVTHKNSVDEVKFRCVTKQKRSLKLPMPTCKYGSDVTMYKCNFCVYKAKSKSHLNVHMLTHKDSSDVVLYRCEKCIFETRHKNSLKGHMLTHKDGSEVTMHKCNLCNFETKWNSALRNHLLIHKDSSDVIMYRCEKCTFETKYKSSLKMHMDTHNNKPKPIMYNCNLCSYKSKRRNNLRRHLLNHKDSSEVIMYNCNLCSYKSNKKECVRRHLLTHKDSSDVIMYRCEKCTFETKYKNSHKMHMLIHKDKSEVTILTHKDGSEVTMHKCHLCNFETKWKKYLVTHMVFIHKHKRNRKVKSEVTIHKCNLCNFETKWKNALKNHLVIHKDCFDVIMYRCDKCTFETKYKSSLMKHMGTHKDKSKVIMYNCNLCSYKSKKRNNLGRHLLTHKDSSDVM